MKVIYEVDPALPEDEVIIRCRSMDGAAERVGRFASSQGANTAIVFYQDEDEYFFPVDEVLFFDTQGDVVYAHTPAETFRTRHRLYELELLLPGSFVRVAKSAIVNCRKIYSIKRDLTGSQRIGFAGTHKHIFASRRYAAALKQRMRGE